MRLVGLMCGACLLLGACSVPMRGRGQSCQRTAQCKLGLACVEGKCSKDLGPIVDQSSVPDLTGDAAVSDPNAGGADAASMSDAG